ncbi:MAG: S-adenosylmethionine synthetase [Thermofilum sp. ex4484_15]|nr:MAG: S-adenosylmethionine synthetase [Thermofilum sp. ex4484_15]
MKEVFNLIVEKLEQKPIEEREVELVERKGLGHPDYIADSIAEAVSRELCIEYERRFGRILHHNLDKVLVVGGRSWRRFGAGEVLQPIYILVAGRATSQVRVNGKDVEMPLGPIVLRAVRNWIKRNFRFLDPDKHVIVDYKIGRGSVDLITVFDKGGGVPLANDTSLGVAFAPLSETERLVLETEKLLNSREFKKELPQVGEDVKVMGLRVGNRIKLTIAAAIIAPLTKNLGEYIGIKEEIKERILDLASKLTEREVEVEVNTADDLNDREGKGVYLVVTGTSAENGDDGMTGRGNRANGLITPLRPMSLEATAGKNPVNHVGKIYNVIASKIASRIAEEIEGVREVYVKMLSQIGKPIDEPTMVSVSILPEGSTSFNDIRYECEVIVKDELRSITNITRSILASEVSLF